MDIFNKEQAKRLFGLLAAGATAGGIVGSAVTSALVSLLGQNWLLALAVLLLELAVYASRRLAQVTLGAGGLLGTKQKTSEPVGGSLFSGMSHVVKSPYLLGIALFILLYSVTSTFLYFQQASIAEAAFTSRAERTAFFADINLWVNAITLIFQLFITGKLIMWLGVGITLCMLPLSSILGFGLLAAHPTITVFVFVQVARRVCNFALAKPAREILFTSLPQEDRYKAKNFIDTVVYRGGDQIGSWTYAGLMALGLSLSVIATLAVPLSVVWLALSLWLGKRQSQKSLS